MPGIVGSDLFKDKIIKKFLVRDTVDIDSREQPLLAKVNTLSVDEVIDIVSSNSVHEMTEKLQRKIKMYMVVKYCRKKCTLTVLADKFELSISGLNMAVHRFKLQLKKDKKIQKVIAGFCKIIDKKCNNV